MSRWEYARKERWSFELLDDRDVRIGWLGHTSRNGGVTSATLDFNANASIRGSGELTFWQRPDAPQIPWATVRVRPILTIRAGGTTTHHRHSTFLPDPTVLLTGTGRRTTLTLQDKSILLDDPLENSYTLPAGTNAVEAAIGRIRALDLFGARNIPESPRTLAYHMAWEADGQNTWRHVVNDLLDYAGYWAIHINLDGQWDSQPYVEPGRRGEAWRFAAGPRSVFVGEIPVDYRFFEVPNRWVAYSRADGDDVALKASAENADPSSPTSTLSRRRTFRRVEVDVEAASQEALDQYVKRRLQAATPGRSYAVSHAWVPVRENDRVHLEWPLHDLSKPATLTKRRITCSAGALVQSEFAEVLSL